MTLDLTKLAIGDLTRALRRSESESSKQKAEDLKVGYRSGIGRVWIQGWVVHCDAQDDTLAYVDDGTGILKLQGTKPLAGCTVGSMVLVVGKPQLVDKKTCLVVHQHFAIKDPNREALWIAEVANDAFTDETDKSA